MLILLLAATLLPLQDDVAQRVKEHVAALRSDSIDKREAAVQALEALGEAALAPLKEHLAAEQDSDVRTLLGEAVARVEKAVQRRNVCRPAQPVTIAAKDRPLEEVVRDVCGQAGVDCAVDAGVAGRIVSATAKKQPLLKVLDDLCGDEVTWETREGRVRFVRGKHPRYPTAYGDVFRVRVKRLITYTTNDFGTETAAIVLNVVPDAEPGVTFRSATLTLSARGAKGEIALKSQGSLASTPMGGGCTYVGSVPVPWDSEHPLETASLALDVPADLQRFEALAVKGTFRFAASTRVVKCNAKVSKEWVTFEGTKLRVYYSGRMMRLDTTDGTPVMDVADLDSMTAVAGDGTEYKFMIAGPRGGRVVSLYSQDMRTTADVELRVSVVGDTFEREMMFEMGSVDVRR